MQDSYLTGISFKPWNTEGEERIERPAYIAQKPRIVLMGTPDFAADLFETLIDSLQFVDIVGIYSRPDAVSARGNEPVPSPVSRLAVQKGIELFKPSNLQDAKHQAQLARLRPDLIIVAAYGMILPKEILEIPTIACVNVHGSLLPRWRGAAPIERAILAGDSYTGVCIMQMEEGLDTGPYCAAKRIEIGFKTAGVIRKELSAAGAWLLVDTIPYLLANQVEWIPQDPNLVTYAEKINKSDLALSPDLSAINFVRRTRASGDSAPARLTVAGKSATVMYAQICDPDPQKNDDSNSQKPERLNTEKRPEKGQALLIKRQGNRHVLLGCSDGCVELVSVKPDGKKVMHASDWFNGFAQKLSQSETGLPWG